MRRKWPGQVAHWFAAAALVLGLTPGIVDAHGALRRSDPAAGGRLTKPLERMRLEFTEAVETRFVRVTLSDSAGRTIERPRLAFSNDRKIVTVADSALGALRGPIVVRWSIAGADGHPVTGTILFRVDAPAAVAAVPTPAMAARDADLADAAAAAQNDPDRWGRVDGPAATVLRWVHYVTLFGLLGAWSATMFVLPLARHRFALDETASRTLQGATGRFARTAAASFVVIAMLRLVAQADAIGATTATNGAGIGALLTATEWGRGWSLALVGVVAAWWAIAARSTRSSTVGVAVGAVALGVSQMGHAAATPQPAAALLTQAAHLLGAGLWIGSLGWLVFVVLGATRGSGPVRAAVVRAFSNVALGGAALLALSGATNAWRYVGSFDAFTTSAYGRVLLAKVAVLALVVGIGFYNWRSVVPRIETDAGAQRLAWSARAELAVALLVLAITARLVVLGAPALGGP